MSATDLPSKTHCISCGQALAPTSNFCTNCGKPLEDTERVASTREHTVPERLIGELETLNTPASATTDAMGSVTTTLANGERGPVFPLALATATTIGRKASDMTFAHDPHMSPRHCTIEGSGARLTATDLGSLNGTYRRLREPVRVGDGAHFVVGQQMLRVRRSRPMSPTIQADGTQRRGSDAVVATWAIEQIDASGEVRDVYHLSEEGAQIGRDTGTIRFPDDAFVSTQHVRVEVEGRELLLTDLDSANGTWLRMDEVVRLRPDDELLCGSTILHFHLPSAMDL